MSAGLGRKRFQDEVIGSAPIKAAASFGVAKGQKNREGGLATGKAQELGRANLQRPELLESAVELESRQTLNR